MLLECFKDTIFYVKIKYPIFIYRLIPIENKYRIKTLLIDSIFAKCEDRAYRRQIKKLEIRI